MHLLLQADLNDFVHKTNGTKPKTNHYADTAEAFEEHPPVPSTTSSMYTQSSEEEEGEGGGNLLDLPAAEGGPPSPKRARIARRLFRSDNGAATAGPSRMEEDDEAEDPEVERIRAEVRARLHTVMTA